MSYVGAFKIFLFVLMCWGTLVLFVGGIKGSYEAYKKNKKDKIIAIPIIIVFQVGIMAMCILMIKFGCDLLVF